MKLTRRRWLWRVVGAIAVVCWLYVTGFFVITFSVFAYSTWHSANPASFFERRDAATCPGYGQRDDDELAPCIHQANVARSDWERTRSAISEIADLGIKSLIPPLVPVGVWVLVCAVRRNRGAAA